MIDLINALWMKERDIVSDGYHKALEYISKIIPLKIHKYPTGMKCWTWIVPEKWGCNSAWIADENGKELLDMKDNPLHVMRYSLPMGTVLSREELIKHLHTKPGRPDAIPFEFKYYERDWGFCIQHNRLKDFIGSRYGIYIDSKFENGHLEVGDFTVKGDTDDTIVIVAHLCHPCMVNDDLTGVSVLIDVAKSVAKKRNHYTYKFLLVPETIGSIAYLSQNEDIIPKLKYGIFLEMLGNDRDLALQYSRQGNTKIDRIARYVLRKEVPFSREGAFRKIICNDELVFNGPGVDVPMISISRWPYPEYHTSDDNPSIISAERLQESSKIISEILDILDTDYNPIRLFKGPVFLSGYGLWVDWKTDYALNAQIDQIMLRMEGDKSVFDISEELGLDFHETRDYINKFYENGLIEKL